MATFGWREMAKQVTDASPPAPAPVNLFTTRRNAFVWLALLVVVLAMIAFGHFNQHGWLHHR